MPSAPHHASPRTAAVPSPAQLVTSRWLRHLRRESKLTLETVAQRLRVPHQVVSQWEEGLPPRDRACLTALLRLYNVKSPDEAVEMLSRGLPPVTAGREEAEQIADQRCERTMWDRWTDTGHGAALRHWLMGLRHHRPEPHQPVHPPPYRTPAYTRAACGGRTAAHTPPYRLAGRGRRPELILLLGQDALEYPVGGPLVMAEQLRYLVSIVQERLATIRVLVPRPHLPPIVFKHAHLMLIEGQWVAAGASGYWYETRTVEVGRARAAFNSHLWAVSEEENAIYYLTKAAERMERAAAP
ncbi:Scr1 family TA system antitoxin-like transcriptional regulator [Streptomyces zhihengii]